MPYKKDYLSMSAQDFVKKIIFPDLMTTEPKPSPSRIIYNNPATIVFWNDGTKTVVKLAKGEKFNKYYAFCAALAKRIYGTNSALTKLVNSGYDQTAKKKKTKPTENEAKKVKTSEKKKGKK